jgi:RNA polymerase sigma-70 factor (ECF subfamily)
VEPRPLDDPQALLAHAGWMRALAFSLLGDPGAADDVVQDATVAALLHAPARRDDLEPWLSRVVRNFAWRRRRGEARRSDREARAQSPNPEPTPADTLERLDLQRLLVEAVRAIDEPLRTTLVLRYFEGKSSAEIAREQGVPAGTVRWRLKRGLDELRERLDGRFGSRASWAVLVAPFARPVPAPPGAGVAASSSKILTGVLAMNAAQVGLTAAALVVVGGIAWWSFGDRSGASEAAAGAAAATVASDADALALDPTRAVAREAVSGADAGSTDAGASGTPATTPAAEETKKEPLVGTVDARFVDEHGAPWSGVRFAAHEVSWLPEWKPGEGVSSDSSGRAELHVAWPELLRNSRRRAEELKLVFVASHAGCATTQRSATLKVGATVHLGDVVLGPGVDLHGRVLDEHGDGVDLASIGIAAVELTEDEGHMRRHGSDAFGESPRARSGSDGGFVLEGVAPGSHRIWAHAEGQRFAWSAPVDVPSDRDVLGFEIVLTPLLATDRIEGRVVGPDDGPAGVRQLWFAQHSAKGGTGTDISVDAQGRFGLLVQYDDSSYDFTAQDLSGRFGTTTLKGVHGGTLDVVIRMQEKRWLAVHVRDAEGGRVEGALFEVRANGLGHDEKAATSAAGDYSIALPDGEFRLTVAAKGFRTRELGSMTAANVPAILDVVLKRAPVVHGRVLAAGAPVAGARVCLVQDYPDADVTVSDYRCRYMLMHGDVGTLTDAEGRFQLDADVDHGFWLRATAVGWAPGEEGPIDAEKSGSDIELDVQLTKGGAIEGRVLLPDGRDGEGTIVALNHGDGSPRTLRAGAKGVFRAEGLSPGDWQVLAVESEIDPAVTKYSSVPTATPIEWSCYVDAGKTTRFDLDLTRH